MARTSTPAPKSKAVAVNDSVLVEQASAANQLAVMTIDANAAATAMAAQIGYQGSLTVGTLEDEIRFYQRRTVEAILETGKRLLVLKELTPHGEFAQRVEMLGFSDRTAQRFMQAAGKTAKSANLAVLSTQVKSASAFLELVTHDEDSLANLADMDDIDRMSASELRNAIRDARAEKVADDKILADKNAKIDKLSRYIKKSTPDQVLADLQKEATVLMNDALGCVRGQIRAAFTAITNHSEEDHSVFMAGILGQLQADVTALREEFNLPDVSNAADLALAAEVAQYAKPTKAAKH